LSIGYRSRPSLEVFLLDPCLKGRVVLVEVSLLDDIGWSASLILGDFSLKDCTSPDSLRFKLDGPKGDIAEESSRGLE
jgi:hypothetical protein